MMVGEPLHAARDDRPDDRAEPEPAHASGRARDAEPLAEASLVSAPSGAADPGISRAELRDMIEKIAWDAFAPVTEKIVREAIARIEQVAGKWCRSSRRR
jgi:hypothetical protein